MRRAMTSLLGIVPAFVLALALTVFAPALATAAEAPVESSSIDIEGYKAGDARTPAEEAAEAILFLVVDAGVVILAIAFLLCLMRIIRGPTLIDRGIATDTISLHIVGIAILLTIGLRSLLFFDAVLIIAIIGFATTVAFAQFVGRRRAV